MKMISKRQHHEETHYNLFYEFVHIPGAGYGFDCDEQGNVDLAKLNPVARQSYHACLTGSTWQLEGVQYRTEGSFFDATSPILCTGTWIERKFKPVEIRTEVRRWTEPAVGLCNRCQCHVPLDGFTNTCECGTDYNMSGQELAGREQWGEETGESLGDILSIDSCTDELFEE